MALSPQSDGPVSGVQIEPLLGDDGHDGSVSSFVSFFISAASNCCTVSGLAMARCAALYRYGRTLESQTMFVSAFTTQSISTD